MQDLNLPLNVSEPLPFPFNQRSFCRYEPIEKRIAAARVLIIDDLLRDENDLSEIGLKELGRYAKSQLKRERQIADMALGNIRNNVLRLVRQPTTETAHFSQIAEAAEKFCPEAIVLGGTLRDFDYYKPELLQAFSRFIVKTRIPVLAICGGHQMVGMAFGANIVTLDFMQQGEQRAGRPMEYQYRFVRITEPEDPIFDGVQNPESGIWQDYTKEACILRVWQNHGLQLDRVPDGFKLLATAYRCKIQMMVKNDADQMIYAVQYHLEKSFEDWNKNRTRWEHPNESRDGRIIFENFLRLALERNKTRLQN